MRCIYAIAEDKKNALYSRWWYTGKKKAKQRLADVLSKSWGIKKFANYKVFRITDNYTITEVK